jgi:voltage-gated potassium channel
VLPGKKREKANFVYKKRRATIRTVLIRFAALLLIILAISTIVYIDRDGYEDAEDGKISPLDSVYFTVISITTTGYGDITPVREDARIIDTIFITIGRAAMWFVIVGTAYQFVFERYREAYLMKAIQSRLSGHVIIAGYSTTGRSAARELLAKGSKKSHIVVITTDPEEAQEAADEGYVSINGDATKEKNLEDAMIKKASSLIIATRTDDTNILITLTAKHLNPEINVISRVTELENIKLLKTSGVEVIIAPAVTSGSMMATATTQPNVVHLLEDVMTARQGMYISERAITEDEINMNPKKLKGMVVIGVARKGRVHALDELDKLKLKIEDRLLFMERK